MSTILPWSFAIITDEVVLAKAFWVIDITMRPGARNWLKPVPRVAALAPLPSASRNTAR